MVLYGRVMLLALRYFVVINWNMNIFYVRYKDDYILIFCIFLLLGVHF
jgi:hypothetical protein